MVEYEGRGARRVVKVAVAEKGCLVMFWRLCRERKKLRKDKTEVHMFLVMYASLMLTYLILIGYF